MLESEQAQAIADIKAAHKGALNIIAWEADCEKAVNVKTVLTMMGKLLEIVDSQAQNNEKLLAENNVLSILVDELKADREAQAKEIERLTKERNDARKLAEDYRDDEYDNDMDLSLAENRLARREYAKNHPLPWEKQ